MAKSHYRINTIVLFLVGAYSDSQGLEDIRKNVVKYIGERDGYPSDPSHIYLTSGASEGIRVSQLKITCLNYNQKGWKLSYCWQVLFLVTPSIFGLREKLNIGAFFFHERGEA